MRVAKSALVVTLVMMLSLGAVAPRGVDAGHRASQPRLRGTVVWSSRPRRALPFDLRDQNGRKISVRSLRGRVSVVTFMNAHCTQACPVIGRELALTQRRLGGARSPLMIVIIDVNPAQDHPRNVRMFAHKVGLVGNWHWLLGTKKQLAPVWGAWGTYVKWARPDIIHTAAVYLVDQQGFVRVADMIPLRPDWLAESVRALLLRHHGRSR